MKEKIVKIREIRALLLVFVFWLGFVLLSLLLNVQCINEYLYGAKDSAVWYAMFAMLSNVLLATLSAKIAAISGGVIVDQDKGTISFPDNEKFSVVRKTIRLADIRQMELSNKEHEPAENTQGNLAVLAVFAEMVRGLFGLSKSWDLNLNGRFGEASIRVFSAKSYWKLADAVGLGENNNEDGLGEE